MPTNFLTDRIFVNSVSGDNLIHIVKPNITTDNPAGSSFKATIDQVASAVTSPNCCLTGMTYDQLTDTLTIFNAGGGSFNVGGVS